MKFMKNEHNVVVGVAMDESNKIKIIIRNLWLNSWYTCTFFYLSIVAVDCISGIHSYADLNFMLHEIAFNSTSYLACFTSESKYFENVGFNCCFKFYELFILHCFNLPRSFLLISAYGKWGIIFNFSCYRIFKGLVPSIEF